MAWPARPERKSPLLQPRDHAAEPACRAARVASPRAARSCRSSAESRDSAQSGTSCRQSTSGRSAAASRIICSQVAAAAGRRGVAVEEVPAARRARALAYEPMRVVVADPPAFTPPYDHALAAALARAGADVELVTSRFRFGDVAAAGRLPPPRALLSALLAALRPLAAAPAAEGARAPARPGAARRSPGGRRPRAVGGRARARRAAAAAPTRRSSSPRTTCCRGARRRRQALWRRALRPLRARRRPQRARPRRPWPRSASPRRSCA